MFTIENTLDSESRSDVIDVHKREHFRFREKK